MLANKQLNCYVCVVFFFRSVTKYSIPLTFGNTEKNDCRPMPFSNLSDLVWCIFYVRLCSYSSCAPSICVQTPAERERKWQHINECVTKTGQETESSGSYEDQKVLYWWADKIGINVVKTKLIDFNQNSVCLYFVFTHLTHRGTRLPADTVLQNLWRDKKHTIVKIIKNKQFMNWQ